LYVPVSVLALAVSVHSLLPTKDPWQHVPVDAARFIKENGLPDNVANPLYWGGYLDYAWRGERRVFIDGRTTQFENGVLIDHGRLFNVTEGSRTVLDMYLINTVLWGRGTALDAALSADAEWVEVYRKGIAVVFVRRRPLM
jgi:hypothetical protein